MILIAEDDHSNFVFMDIVLKKQVTIADWLKEPYRETDFCFDVLVRTKSMLSNTTPTTP